MNCAICSKKSINIKKEGKFSFVVCNYCKIRYHYPLPDKTFLSKWYSKESFSKRWKGNLQKAIQVNYNQNKGIFKTYFDNIKKKVISLQDKKILDIGCYDGNFLTYFKKEGAICTGIDLNGGLIEFGKRSFGLDLRVGTLEDFIFDNESFDIITFNQVLEHLPNPVEFINRVKQLLKLGGTIEFSVPDYELNKKIDFPNHLFHFIEVSLYRLMEQTKLCSNVISDKEQKALIVLCYK